MGPTASVSPPPISKPSLYPRSGSGAFRVKADARQAGAAAPGASARAPTRATPVAEVDRPDQRKRDERLWLLASREDTVAAYQLFLVQASPGALQRPAAIEHLQRLEATRPEWSGPPRSPSPGNVDGKPAEQFPRGPKDWEPEPPPEFKLSLDRPLRLIGKKLGRD